MQVKVLVLEQDSNKRHDKVRCSNTKYSYDVRIHCPLSIIEVDVGEIVNDIGANKEKVFVAGRFFTNRLSM